MTRADRPSLAVGGRVNAATREDSGGINHACMGIDNRMGMFATVTRNQDNPRKESLLQLTARSYTGM